MSGSEQFDDVTHPAHYCKGRLYEPRKVIRDWELNFNLGSAMKYLSRCGRKGDVQSDVQDTALQDLAKARQYIDFEIEALEEEKHETTDER